MVDHSLIVCFARNSGLYWVLSNNCENFMNMLHEQHVRTNIQTANKTAIWGSFHSNIWNKSSTDQGKSNVWGP